MKKIMFILPVLGLFALQGVLSPCTMFTISKGGKVLVGNNEDWEEPLTKVWFEPGGEGKFGRVYFGFSNLFPQGGMNERGLVFDGFATAPFKVKNQQGKPKFEGNLTDKVMSECSTVREVIDIFKRYNLEYLDRAMFMFADASGDSVIIEGEKFIRKKGDFQVVTNFYQSELEEGQEAPCPRYKLAVAMLKESPAELDACRKVLAAVHNEGDWGGTQYSNIYDPAKKIVYLYHFHNFENVFVIDLEKELKQGKHEWDLPALFPKTFVAERYMKLYIAKQRKPIELDPAVYDKYVGEYEVRPGAVITITREGDRLYGQATGNPRAELFPASETRFFLRVAEAEIEFILDDSGKVTELVLYSDKEQRAKRIDKKK